MPTPHTKHPSETFTAGREPEGLDGDGEGAWGRGVCRADQQVVTAVVKDARTTELASGK